MSVPAGHAKRLCARLDVKAPNLVKGIQLEGLRVLGSPGAFAKRYVAAGIDELLYIDVVASLYGRNSLDGLVRETAAEVFVPLTVCGGIRSVEDVRRALRCGADKIAFNTAAVGDPGIITSASRVFGSQCVVLSVEAKCTRPGHWEVYTDNGRNHTGLDVLAWVQKAVGLGAGEVLLTSVDRDGTYKGFDLDLIAAVAEGLSVPLIASGGAGSPKDVVDAYRAGADAVAVGGMLHTGKTTVAVLKAEIGAAGFEVREP